MNLTKKRTEDAVPTFSERMRALLHSRAARQPLPEGYTRCPFNAEHTIPLAALVTHLTKVHDGDALSLCADAMYSDATTERRRKFIVEELNGPFLRQAASLVRDTSSSTSEYSSYSDEDGEKDRDDEYDPSCNYLNTSKALRRRGTKTHDGPRQQRQGDRKRRRSITRSCSSSLSSSCSLLEPRPLNNGNDNKDRAGGSGGGSGGGGGFSGRGGYNAGEVPRQYEPPPQSHVLCNPLYQSDAPIAPQPYDLYYPLPLAAAAAPLLPHQPPFRMSYMPEDAIAGAFAPQYNNMDIYSGYFPTTTPVPLEHCHAPLAPPPPPQQQYQQQQPDGMTHPTPYFYPLDTTASASFPPLLSTPILSTPQADQQYSIFSEPHAAASTAPISGNILAAAGGITRSRMVEQAWGSCCLALHYTAPPTPAQDVPHDEPSDTTSNAAPAAASPSFCNSVMKEAWRHILHISSAASQHMEDIIVLGPRIVIRFDAPQWCDAARQCLANSAEQTGEAVDRGREYIQFKLDGRM